jgi:hypothetical protein
MGTHRMTTVLPLMGRIIEGTQFTPSHAIWLDVLFGWMSHEYRRFIGTGLR